MHKLTTIPGDTHPLVAVNTEFRTPEYRIIQHEPTFMPYCYWTQCSKPVPLYSHNYIRDELTMQLTILTHALTTWSLPSIHYTTILYYKCDTYFSPCWLQLAEVRSTICCSCSVTRATNCRFNSLTSDSLLSADFQWCLVIVDAMSARLSIGCGTAHSLLQPYTEFPSCEHHPDTLTHPIIITFKRIKIYRNWVLVPVHSLV